MYKKANGHKLTLSYLENRVSETYGKQKWIQFCEILINEGYDTYLYEARKTFSKYITIRKGNKKFKVRFSNHKPIKYKELLKDCDFFVGVNNFKVTTTDDALNAVRQYMEENLDDSQEN